MISGKEMKYQIFGTNFLFVAALIIVLGSMLGEWLGVHQFLELSTNFLFGHQGYEYMDLGALLATIPSCWTHLMDDYGRTPYCLWD